jgi:ribosome-associated protein
MIPVTASLSIDERDLEERFIRASGPGGQNVNKVSTAVELRFRLRGFTELPEDVLARLEGEIVIRADEHRTQDRNRAEAQARLVALVKQATFRPKPRIKTKISKAQKAKRVDNKTRRGDIKANRGRVRDHD